MKTTAEQRETLFQAAQFMESRNTTMPLSAGLLLDLLDDLNDAEATLTYWKTDVGKAAQYLNVAGPLSHRVRMFQQHYSEIILRQRDLLRLARLFLTETSYDMTLAPDLVEHIDQELHLPICEEGGEAMPAQPGGDVVTDMKPPLKVEDLNKSALLALVERLDYPPTQKQLVVAVWEGMVAEAKAKMDDAMRRIQANAGTTLPGPKRDAWWRAQNDFDEAQKLHTRAGQYFDTYVCPPGQSPLEELIEEPADVAEETQD